MVSFTDLKKSKDIIYKKMHLAAYLAIRLMDGIGYLFLKSPERKINTRDVKKIIVIEPGNLGDFMMSVPSFAVFRDLFPDASITLVGMPYMKELLKVFSYFDEFIPYKHLFWRLRFSPLLERIDPRHEMSVIKRLKQEKSDLFVDLEGDPVDILIGLLSGIKQRIGRNSGGGGFWLTSVAKHNNSKSETEMTMDVVEMLGDAKSIADYKVNIDADLKESISSILAGYGINDNDFMIAFMPGASWQWKAWPPERFAELSKKILDSYNVKIILLGTKKEKGIASVIEGLTTDGIVDVTGETDIVTALAIINRADLVIGNDSGGIHMAALFKKPLIQLFGPCEPDRFAYSYEGARLFHYKDCPYYPCSMRRCRNKEDWCMKKIEVNDVFGAAEEYLANRSLLHERLDKDFS